MKNFGILIILMLVGPRANAQLKKDGTPDICYNSNRQIYGNSYSVPSYGTTYSDIGYQRGYERNGTYVELSYHTQPNGTNTDNWSTRGNTNPFTGKQGTRAQDYSYDAYNYGQGQTIQTGSRGGQYYLNSNGNRTYVPKRP